MMSTEFDFNFNYAAGAAPVARALFKQSPEDFQVTEELGFELDADEQGEHHWLQVKKRGANTDFVARQLAKHADIPFKQVSYSGIKDRQAVTTQWFSVQLPATRVIDWSTLHNDEFEILTARKQGRKLRRGTHKSNFFEISLRSCTNRDALDAALQQVKEKGVPHYYGPQRFGHNGGNMERAVAMFAGKRVRDRNLRSLLLSSARSYIFNHYVSRRLAELPDTPVLTGDVMMLSGTNSFFTVEAIDEALLSRIQDHDIVVSGPLWGRGETPAQGAAQALERRLQADFNELCEGLEKAGLKQERRAMFLMPEGLEWSWRDDTCVLTMSLPAGAYATSVLREVAELRETI
ncbi:tRNA pseudouridine(13) synthase TruD [Aliidiomarina sp. Khilg15.8]